MPKINYHGISRKDGSGCLIYNESVILAKNGYSTSQWELPDFLFKTEISYHSDKHRIDEYFQSVARGQEFVFSVDERPVINKWASDFIGAKHPREKETELYLKTSTN